LTASASDKPVWTIDFKTLNLPKYRDPWYPRYKIQFTPDNKILISFLEQKPQTKLTTKDVPEKPVLLFVALLLSGENGELIRRVEWPVMPEAVPARQPRIYPLPSGGYLVIIDRLDFAEECPKTLTHLQMFDSSFNIIHDRVWDTLEPGKGLYKIIVPLSGKYIALKQSQFQSSVQFVEIVEIIDSSTFETMERFEQPDFGIVDIWKDRLLAISYDGNSKSRFFEKKVGAFQWNVLGFTQWTGLHGLGLTDSRSYANPRFIYNGAIIFKDIIEQSSTRKINLVMIEDGKKSGPFFEGCISKPSWNSPIVACEKSKLSTIRELLDLFAKRWIETFDLSTKKVLLTTKKSSDMVDYEISPDGNSIIIMTQKKIELYTVKSKR